MNISNDSPAPETPEPSVGLSVPSGSLIQGRGRNMPFRLSVTIPLIGWRLHRLRDLQRGQLIVTGVSATEDVPVTIGEALLAHAELDNVDGQMAIRLTRLD